ncbi:Uncharacterized protein FKW44_021796 [Caligus rogercresseyi]|uniref:Uncharacterized protein n=1 Tax=Caligus rogercresseyi TaxID=217165 RepID=A0A7T8GRX2_CALRO|nr:Uncharacterized protein FKW44_021796 [Caligus rogercresseyi]
MREKCRPTVLLLLIVSAASLGLSPHDFPDVAEHYTQYPYPPIPDIESEDREASPVYQGPSLGEINHFLYGGRMLREGPYRIWVVGGGTGNSSLFYAHEFRHIKNLEIVHSDVSGASLDIARKRAELRGLK